MDGLSCIASVVAVIQLTELVLKTAHDRLGLGPSRFDKGSLQDILQKLYALNGTLSSLKIHLEINEADQARLLALKNLNDPLDRCKDALELIKNWLESSSFLGRHIVGKRFDKKYDQAVKVLEESQRLMQLCLLSDQQTIVSAVEQYLRVMIEDVQDIQSTLNDNGKRIMDLEQSFQRKAKEIRTGTEKVGKQLSKLEREEYIRSLPYAEGAALDSNLRQISGCFPNTRVSIIKNIESWNQDVTGKPIFWLNGMAGAGKSTIAHTVASRLHNAGALAASFSFSRGAGDLAKATKFVTTMATQIAESFPETAPLICNVIAENRNIYRIGLRDQWMQLVLGPLKLVDPGGMPSILTFVVDALDECDSESDIRLLLQLFTECKTVENISLKVFLTSRPEVPIRLGFKGMNAELHEDFVLHEIAQAEIQHDISLYLRYEFDLISKDHELSDWPGEDVIAELARRADKLFIYASSMCRFIKESKWSPHRCLSRILTENQTFPQKSQLDSVYNQVIQDAVSSGDHQDTELVTRFKDVVGSIVTLFDALSVTTLSEVLNVPIDEVQAILNSLHSVLIVPESLMAKVQLLHPSFRDFLLDEKRCNKDFFVKETSQHKTIVRNCLRVMSQHLKQDICSLKNSNFLAASTDPHLVEKYVASSVQYSCVHWILHFELVLKDELDQEFLQATHAFLKQHILHIFEVFSLLRKMDAAVSMTWSLRSICRDCGHEALAELASEAYKFSVTNRYIIEQSPLRTYNSGWIFDKTSNRDQELAESRDNSLFSVIYSPFKDSADSGDGIGKTSAISTMLVEVHEGNFSPVRAVAFSPTGEKFASGSADTKVRLWDTESGALLQTFSGHLDWIRAVTFSPDGTRIMSGSMDNTVRLFDISAGTIIQTFSGHTGSVWSVKFSQAGDSVFSGSEDGTIRQWDLSGKLLQTLKDDETWVWSIAVSADKVVSGSGDGRVRLWDLTSGSLLKTLPGHLNWVWSIDFSPNGDKIVSGSRDSTIRVWDTESGSLLAKLEGHSGSVRSVVFAPCGNKIVSAARDSTVRVWDAASGLLLRMFKGRLGSFWSVALSPSGGMVVSGSDYGVLRSWNIQDPNEDKPS